MKRALLAGIIFLATACAAPQNPTKSTMLAYDSETSYTVEGESNGFLLTVYYSSAQILPGQTDMASNCRDKLKEVAEKYAATQSKEIIPLEDRKIRVSQDRNGFSGMTSCTVYGHVQYKRQRR